MIARSGLLVACLLAVTLAGCGNRRELKPLAGHVLPRAPYGVGYKPTADQMLKEPSQARPERNVDVRVRSQERTDDPFDLPPEH
jgi:uncharacterized lipoprotein YehR (DUF1307 family)